VLASRGSIIEGVDVTNLRERSLELFPAGSNGEFNLPEELSIVIARGQGCELWDSQDRHFYDFSMGWGSCLVGHACPEVVAAVTRRAPLGSNFAYVTDESVQLAEELVRLSPACEQVRFCASGTEATMYCLRLARAFTGKPLVLKFEGAYHGAHDVGVVSLFPADPPAFPQAAATSAGLAPHTIEETLVAPFNDLEATREIVLQARDRLAAIIVEPFHRCLSPLPGFLSGLRHLCDETGVLLIFDEVVTGFRLAYGGAQEYYGVIPDLVAYGKALGGGYPIGAFGGRHELMQQVREDQLGQPGYVWTASTLGGNPVSCAAAQAALIVLAREGIYERLHRLGDLLREGMRAGLAKHGYEAQVIGDGPLAQFVLSPETPRDYRSTRHRDPALARRLMLGLFGEGIFLNPMGTKLYLSIAHDDRVCEIFLERFARVLTTVARA